MGHLTSTRRGHFNINNARIIKENEMSLAALVGKEMEKARKKAKVKERILREIDRKKERMDK